MSFNLGHLLQIATLIIAATVGWVTMDARTSTNSDGIKSLRGELAETQARIRAVETSSVRADERMQGIFTLLARIDARLERIEDGK